MEIEVTEWFLIDAGGQKVTLVIEDQYGDDQLTDLDVAQAKTLVDALQKAIRVVEAETDA